MGRKRGKPVILDYLIPFHISYLTKAFALKWVSKSSKEINLHATNPITGKKQIMASIQVTVHIDIGTGNDYADVEYSLNSRLRTQRIELITKKIKLTGGIEYFFKCPVTGERRRKFFLHNDRFVSKEAIEGGYYLSQIQSKKHRNGIRDLKRMIKYQNAVRQGNRKYFMKHYNGSQTKSYLKLLESADKLNGSW